MKKLSLLLLIVIAFGAFGTVFQSCNNTKTYAEMLEEERDAINKFISKHNIKAISTEQFLRDTATNLADNEYVQFSNGSYLQIINRGSGDSIVSRNEVILRMIEYNVMAEINENVIDTISNVDVPDLVDSFFYNPEASQTQFVINRFNGYFPYIYRAYGMISGQTVMDVPKGIIDVLPYLRDGAHVKLIVPSKLGHTFAMQYVYPFYYEIRKLQIK